MKEVEPTILERKEKIIAEIEAVDNDDWHTHHIKNLMADFEPGDVCIEKVDHEYNISLPTNIMFALGVETSDHIRFEAVDRETFKISKIR